MRTFLVWVSLLCFSGSVYSQTPAPKIDWKFWVVAGADVGATTADVWITHNCLQAQICHEARPLMPSSLSGQVTINLSLFASELSAASKLRKQGSKIWWLPLVSGTSTHLAGVGVTLSQ